MTMPALMTQEVAPKKRPMLRYLRILFSSMFLVACLLLIALWVRSYSWLDRLRIGDNAAASINGRLIANAVYNTSKTHPELMETFSRHASADNYFEIWMARQGALIPVGLGKSIPFWPLVAATATLTILPWLRWRFSLRTLLIAMTLIAALFGIIAISN